MSQFLATAFARNRPRLRLPDVPPLFLAPALQNTITPIIPRASFSTSGPKSLRNRDNNKSRGVSALRRTGLKHPLSMSKEPLPQPVLDPKKRSKVKVDENHGLYGFFNKDRKALSTPEEDNAHGRFYLRHIH